MNNKWVCADCGHEQSDMTRCARCASVRVVLVSVAEELFGADWRNAFNEPQPDLEAKR